MLSAASTAQSLAPPQQALSIEHQHTTCLCPNKHTPRKRCGYSERSVSTFVARPPLPRVLLRRRRRRFGGRRGARAVSRSPAPRVQRREHLPGRGAVGVGRDVAGGALGLQPRPSSGGVRTDSGNLSCVGLLIACSLYVLRPFPLRLRVPSPPCDSRRLCCVLVNVYHGLHGARVWNLGI